MEKNMKKIMRGASKKAQMCYCGIEGCHMRRAGHLLARGQQPPPGQQPAEEEQQQHLVLERRIHELRPGPACGAQPGCG